MSLNKLGIALFSAFLMFAMAPVSRSQQSTNPDTTKKQTTTQQGTTTTESGKATTPDQQTTAKTKTKKTTKKSTETTTTGTEKKTDETGKATETKKPAAKKTSGISSSKVRETQTALKNDGFDPGPIDGIMGPMTMTALRNYQSHNKLEVTGTLTPETKNSLLSGATASREKPAVERAKPSEGATHPDKSKDMSQYPGTTTTPESLGLREKSSVSSIEDIRHIQQSLSDLGYNPGDANGMMTSQTQQAVREFQWFNNLPVTGVIDDQTKMAIDAQAGGSSTPGPISRSYGPSPLVATLLVAQYPAETETTKKGHKDSTAYTGKVDKDASDRIMKSSEVLQDLAGTPDKKIPNELLERAQAIAVVPHMIKGAFGIGGRYGKGVVSERMENGRWSPPSFLTIGGGSFGAQLGVTATDLVLVFTDRKALSLLQGGKDLKLGADAAVAAGPIGRTAEAGVNAKLETAIYAYSRSKGLFAGVALDGAVLDIDNSMNAKVYGPSVDATQIFNGKAAMNSTVRPFVDTLDKVVPPKRLTQK
jgi:lipid-binding SYLF domain-containing protein/peptidoglycan hydrolase-like protein with peptidoglycan-binding domain